MIPDPPAQSPAPSAARRRRPAWIELPLLVALTLVVAALIRAFLVQPFFIPSGSMENTLRVGDRVLVDKVSYRFGDISRGDVVVFNGLDSFTPEVQVDRGGNPVVRGLRRVGGMLGLGPSGETDFIKRVIGIAGDRVVCCDAKGRITVNGTALDEPSYLYAGDAASESRFDITVPPGRLWVMGDHRSASADSRSHTGDPGGGTVPEDKVVGRAFSVVWPLRHATGLGVPSTFEHVRSAENGRATNAPTATAGADATDVTDAPYALALGAVPPLVVRRRRCSGTEMTA